MKRIIFNGLIVLLMCSVSYGKDVMKIEQPANDIEIITRSGAFIPFQFAVVEQLQLVPKEKSITGLKLNFVYGCNFGIIGADLGLISKSQYTAGALQFNLMNIVEQKGSGFQIGLFNLAQSYNGVQVGVFNLCGLSSAGLQVGFLNYSSICSGFQLGVVNKCNTINGVQIGLINIIQDSNLRVCPIMNMKF